MRVSPASSASRTWRPAHGSIPAPNSPVSPSSSSAAGRAIEPLRPMKERRLAVAEIGRSLVAANATWPANSTLYGLRREDRVDARLVVGDDVTAVALARRAEDPVVVREDAEMAQHRRGVDERQLREPHRVGVVHEDRRADDARPRSIARNASIRRYGESTAARSMGSGPSGRASDTTRGRYRRRARRSLHRRDRRPDRWRTVSAGSRGCCRTTWSPIRWR